MHKIKTRHARRVLNVFIHTSGCLTLMTNTDRQRLFFLLHSAVLHRLLSTSVAVAMMVMMLLLLFLLLLFLLLFLLLLLVLGGFLIIEKNK